MAKLTVVKIRIAWSTGVGGGPPPPHDRERHADHDRHQGAVADQGETGHEALANQRRDALAERDRLAEVPAEQVPEEEPVLLGQGLVEPEARADTCDFLDRGPGSEHRGDWIARHEVDQHERQERQAEQLYEADADTPCGVGEHGG
jgi:hypothetical protein